MRYHELMESAAPEWRSVLDLDEPARSNCLKAFNKLAQDQRGTPEDMGGGGNQNPGLRNNVGVYHYATEHIGDVTNRMAKGFHVTDQDCGFFYVERKVLGVLRDVRRTYGFEREINEQLRSNYRYAVEEKAYTGSFEEWQDAWVKAGRLYAKAHAMLTVYNEAQWHARQAAVTLGLHDYASFRHRLEALASHLESPEAWSAYASLVRVDDNDQPIPYDGPR